MNFRKQCSRIFLGAGLVVALAAVPATQGFAQRSQSTQSNARSAMQSHTGQVDINTATEGQLRAISGVGSVYAQRIIAGRPYSTKNQLVSKGVLPQGVYDKIKGQIVAHRMKK